MQIGTKRLCTAELNSTLIRARAYFDGFITQRRLGPDNQQGNIIVTSNLPFSQLSSAFTDDTTLTAALLNSFFHHSLIIQISGESYRLRGNKAAGTIPAVLGRSESKN